LEAGNTAAQETSQPAKRKFNPKGFKITINVANDTLNENWESWTSFFQPRKALVVCLLLPIHKLVIEQCNNEFWKSTVRYASQAAHDW
jgi:hypothetical protein